MALKLWEAWWNPYCCMPGYPPTCILKAKSVFVKLSWLTCSSISPSTGRVRRFNPVYRLQFFGRCGQRVVFAGDPIFLACDTIIWTCCICQLSSQAYSPSVLPRESISYWVIVDHCGQCYCSNFKKEIPPTLDIGMELHLHFCIIYFSVLLFWSLCNHLIEIHSRLVFIRHSVMNVI